MRKVRYSVASSLDGFIAGPNGEYDWIVTDPAIDFNELYAGFDTVLMGRRTFEAALGQGSGGAMPGMRVNVFSRTLRPADYPKVTILDDAVAAVKELKEQGGKDIWLFGGGSLLRGLLEAGLVDSVEVGLMPVILGAGIPLMAGPYGKFPLKLTSSRILDSGILMLRYDAGSPASARRQRRARPQPARKIPVNGRRDRRTGPGRS
jgi:dihydrofolate reductase